MIRISYRPKAATRPTDVEIVASAQAVAEQAAELTRVIAKQRIKASGQFVIALAGGSTPRLYHEILATKHQNSIDWSHVHVFFSDDRAVPLTHKDSNYHIAEETLLSHVPIPSTNVHRIEGDDGDNVRAAAEYERTIAQFLGEEMLMDLVCLGMGEDGHTASLFPHAKDSMRNYVIPTEAPVASPVPRRVSFSYSAIAKARNLLVMLTGAAKANRLFEVLTGEGDLPMQRVVRERLGDTLFIVDNAAASMLVEARKKA